MLKVVDEHFTPAPPQPSLIMVSRHIRESAEHLAAAYNMLANVDLADRARLQLAIFDAAARTGIIVSALAQEIAAASVQRQG